MTDELIDQLKAHIGEQGADINKLERQLFIAERTIAEQKEIIERITKSSSNRLVGLCKCGIERDEQSALIEKLAEALDGAFLRASGWPIAAEEALAAYKSWKGKV